MIINFAYEFKILAYFLRKDELEDEQMKKNNN